MKTHCFPLIGGVPLGSHDIGSILPIHHFFGVADRPRQKTTRSPRFMLSQVLPEVWWDGWHVAVFLRRKMGTRKNGQETTPKSYLGGGFKHFSFLNFASGVKLRCVYSASRTIGKLETFFEFSPRSLGK